MFTDTRNYLFAAVMAVCAGCTGRNVVSEMDSMQMPIFFDIVAGQYTESKSLFGPGDLYTEGNRIRVFDKFTINSESVMYIDGEEMECDGSAWNFADTKYWTKSGSHSFVAYSSYNITDGFGSPDNSILSYDKESESLSIADWVLDEDTQFDFVYGYHTRNMDEGDSFRPVTLQMKHLLCAVRFNIINLYDINAGIVVSDFILSGLCNNQSAVILKPQGSDAPSVSYELPQSVSKGQILQTAEKTLTYNVPYNVFADLGKIGSQGFLLMWPHPQGSAFSGLSVSFSQLESNGTKVDRVVRIGTDYSINNWKPGYKYTYNLYVKDDRISVAVEVVDWIDEDIDLD